MNNFYWACPGEGCQAPRHATWATRSPRLVRNPLKASCGRKQPVHQSHPMSPNAVNLGQSSNITKPKWGWRRAARTLAGHNPAEQEQKRKKSPCPASSGESMFFGCLNFPAGGLLCAQPLWVSEQTPLKLGKQNLFTMIYAIGRGRTTSWRRFRENKQHSA